MDKNFGGSIFFWKKTVTKHLNFKTSYFSFSLTFYILYDFLLTLMSAL